MSDDRSSSTVVIALIQMSCSVSRADNSDKAIKRIEDAAEQGANVVCLQELFHSRYPCQREDHDQFAQAESIPGPTTEALSRVARERELVVIAPIFERRTAGLFHNSAVVIDADGQQLGIYRKMHIPDDPLYYEKFYFTPGDLGFQTFPTRFGRIGVCICWDQWFPEAARLTALSGAQIIFYPTAIGWLPDEKQQWGESQTSAWQTMMRSHAIANGVFVAASNRVGNEGELEFWGSSFVADPYGNMIATASSNAEETLIVECHLDQIEAARTHWPFLRDRRTDAYDGLTKRFLDDVSAE